MYNAIVKYKVTLEVEDKSASSEIAKRSITIRSRDAYQPSTFVSISIIIIILFIIFLIIIMVYFLKKSETN
jgi:hypothetical protein